MKNSPPLARVILYVHNMQTVSAFYQTHFGFQEVAQDDADLTHLTSPSGGCDITLLKASKGQKRGQSLVKLVFDVDDVEAFKKKSGKRGISFGIIHRGENYAFANVRDPANNLVQISSRRFRRNKS